MPEISMAYLAGFFDGEGHVSILKSRRGVDGRIRWWLRIGVSNTFPDVVHEMKRRFGGSVHLRQPRSIRHNPCYDWVAQYQIAEACLKVLLPFLVVKRKDAEIALSFQSAIRGRKYGRSHRLTQEEQSTREQVRMQMIDKHGLASRAYQGRA